MQVNINPIYTHVKLTVLTHWDYAYYLFPVSYEMCCMYRFRGYTQDSPFRANAPIIFISTLLNVSVLSRGHILRSRT